MFMPITREFEKLAFLFIVAMFCSRISSQYLDAEGLCISSIVFKHHVTGACLLNSHQRANVCPLFRHETLNRNTNSSYYVERLAYTKHQGACPHLHCPIHSYFPLYYGDQDKDKELAKRIVSTARSNIKPTFYCLI